MQERTPGCAGAMPCNFLPVTIKILFISRVISALSHVGPIGDSHSVRLSTVQRITFLSVQGEDRLTVLSVPEDDRLTVLSIPEEDRLTVLSVPEEDKLTVLSILKGDNLVCPKRKKN